MSLDAIGIVCKEIKKSIEFYSKFGLEFQAMGGEQHFEATTKSGLRLMLDTEELMLEINPQWKRTVGASIVICFKQENSQSVDSLVKATAPIGKGIVKDPWDAFWGQRYSSILDPDGNQVDVFADLAGE